MAHVVKADPISQLEEDLECTVCLEVLKDPRTLPCCHSFCKDCLEGVVQTCRDTAPNGQPIREIPCPNCRATFPLDPHKHVADMPRNHFICNLVKVMAVLDRGIGVPCSHNCNQSYSVARCVTCEKFLCRECLTDHNRYRGHNDHSVLTMEELSKPENRKKIKDKIYCNEHSGKKLKVYCESCNELICKDCMDFKHIKQEGHSCFLVKDVANKYKELLALNNKAMEDVLTEGHVYVQQLSLTTKQLDRDVENIKKQIVEKKEVVLKNVAEMLEQKTDTLLNKVDEIYEDKRANLDKQTEETNQFVENIKTSVQLSKKLVDQGTEEEIISSQKMMLDNANNLLTKREEYFKASIPVAKFRYTGCTDKEPMNEEILTSVAKGLGEVSEENNDKGETENQTDNHSTIQLRYQRGDENAMEEMTLRKGKAENQTGNHSKNGTATGEKVLTASASRVYGEAKHENGKQSKMIRRRYERDGNKPDNRPAGKTISTESLSCVLSENVKVFVYKGDITKEITDVIVNSSNGQLDHSGGLPGEIVEAGGGSIQDESDEIMRERSYNNLTPGEVAVTQAGDLPCNFIIHAVCPKWNNYSHQDAAKHALYTAVYNCLTTASQNGATSISIPALGSRICCFPLDICVKVLFTAVTNFAESASKAVPLEEIRFVDIDKSTSQAFAKEMRKRFGDLVKQEKVEVNSFQ